MPMKARKEGHKVLFIEVPEELKERLRAVADRNHRSMVGEAVVAIEKHVKAEEAASSSEDNGSTKAKAKGKGRASA